MATPDTHTTASLYVGDLAHDINEALLFEIFNAVGPVASIRVCRDAVSRRSLGYAYVNFHNVADAERAIDTMNYTTIGGRSCRIMWSQRDPSLRKSGVGNIFVKNLDKSIDHKALYDTFSAFGNILSCKVATNMKGESLGYGFVHYETDEAAQKAINNVNSMIIAEKTVYVGPFIPKEQRGPSDAVNFTNVYVKNLPDDFDEETLRDLFSKCGDITSVYLGRHEDGRIRGFGFVNFEDPNEANEAVNMLNEYQIGDKKLYVSRAMKKEERRKFLADRYESKRMENEKKWAGCNLYVKNLADNVDEEALTKLFEQYGGITSIRIMTDRNTNKSKGFGFVCFSTPEEAANALTELNSHVLDGKPLYVAIAQKKEIRRAQLEAQYAASRSSKIGAMANMYPGPMYFPPGGMGTRGFVYPAPMNRRYAPPTGGVPVTRNMYPVNVPPTGSRRGGRGNRGGARGGKTTRSETGALGKLTLSTIAAAPAPAQKQMIGERLFPLIRDIEPKRAGKITGMLLEMDNADLVELLDSNEFLKAKVGEAVDVLNRHEGDEVSA